MNQKILKWWKFGPKIKVGITSYVTTKKSSFRNVLDALQIVCFKKKWLEPRQQIWVKMQNFKSKLLISW